MKSSSRSFAVIMIICGMVIVGVLMYFMWSSWNSAMKTASIKRNTAQLPVSISQEATTTRMGEIVGTRVQVSSTLQSIYAKALARTSLEKKSGQVDVNWYEAEEISSDQWSTVFAGVASGAEIAAFSTSTVSDSSSYDHVWLGKLWRVGMVMEGPYASGTVYTTRLEADFPFFSESLEFVLSQDGMRIAAVKEIEDASSTDATAIVNSLMPSSHTDVISLHNGMSPKYLHVKGKKLQLSSALPLGVIYDPLNYLVDTSKLVRVATSDEGIELYQSLVGDDVSMFRGDGCLLALMPDGAWFRYSAFLSAFMGDQTPVFSRGGETRVRNPGIKWDPMYQNNDTYYGVTMTGCGLGFCSDIANLSKEELSDLAQVGVDKATEDPIFVLQHPDKSALIASLYDMWYLPDQREKPSLAEMLEMYKAPVFFWKDAVGRWNRYTISSLMPAVECGKPVIYLYPQTTTDVSVKLPRSIKVTVSEPQYPANGWNVTASSSGLLISKTDGKMYDSLYWEGTGVSYQTPKTGFVIKGSEVSKFLSSVLPKYGLNSKETKDFMDFWVPKIESVPYARISFLTSAWTKAVPLAVTPRPQTNIRIFMDWQPLSAPISIKAPTIVTPTRNGFTLVEWGGLLYK